MDLLLVSLLVAFLIDLMIGDPERFPHPVRGIGWLAIWLEEKIVAGMGRNRFSGTVFTVIIVGGTNFYGGTVRPKPLVGNPKRELMALEQE